MWCILIPIILMVLFLCFLFFRNKDIKLCAFLAIIPLFVLTMELCFIADKHNQYNTLYDKYIVFKNLNLDEISGYHEYVVIHEIIKINRTIDKAQKALNSNWYAVMYDKRFNDLEKIPIFYEK